MSIKNLSIVENNGPVKDTNSLHRLQDFPCVEESHASYHLGQITELCENGDMCVINSSIYALVADGLLLSLRVGDLVAYLQGSQGVFVIQVVKQQGAERRIELDKKLHVSAHSICFAAEQDLELVSVNRLAMTARHGVISAAETLVSTAEHAIHQVAQFMVSAKGLLRLNGKNQLITAEEDVRVDGKRINMG